MNYSVLIQNRKSVREFADTPVSAELLHTVWEYYHLSCRRLVSGIGTGLTIFGSQAREALEGAAGYHNFLPGAPHYMVLLSESHPQAHINAGFMMQDMLLKLQDLGLDSCWITFGSSELIKQELGIDSPLDVAAIAAFGYGKKAPRRLRLNILTMSNVDIKAKRHYFEPKRALQDLVFADTWGNTHGVEEKIGFFDDMLWEAFYAASLSPSYLNRQAYGFLLGDGKVTLVRRPDEYTTDIDGDLSLGAMLLHFTAVAEMWAGKLCWQFNIPAVSDLPLGHSAVAECIL